MWDYLQTKELDLRFQLAEGYLRRSVACKNIVDLNCGTARFLLYLPVYFNSYYCNDINYEVQSKIPRVYFQKTSDEVMAKYLEDKEVNILCVFGMGGGDILPNEHESKTLVKSAIKIVEDHEPEFVVLEANLSYVRDHKVMDELRKFLEFGKGYKVDLEAIVRPAASSDPLSERVLAVFTKSQNQKQEPQSSL